VVTALTPAERKARYRANPENRARDAARSKAWREANPEKVKANNDRWNTKETRDRYKETQRRCGAEHYRANRERKAETTAAWRAENRDRVNEYQRRRRARKMGSDPDLTTTEWLEILEEFDHCCAYCQARDVSLEIEHVTPISRGGRHTRANVVPACRSCNARKGAKTLFEFAAVG
jgi:5-methylcytosine-specific restriction endonuclease McrA